MIDIDERGNDKCEMCVSSPPISIYPNTTPHRTGLG